MKKKDYLIMAVLICLPVLFIIFIMPEGKMFAHRVDWISQHAVVPDYFRQLFYDSGNLFNDFAPHLEGGTNIYAFSYYGLFRPDVLISFLLPSVSMATIIISYMVAMMSLGSCMCYLWLRRKGYTASICAFASFLLICSSFFFQAHKQIMFVNYLPFLIMTFIAIDVYIKKQKSTWMIVCILMIILHSYFFSIAAIIICIFYYLYELGKMEKLSLHRLLKKDILRFAVSILIAIMIAGILLLPTAFIIMENTKDVASTNLGQLLTLSLDLKGLLYNAYGCGLTMLAWICLLLGLNHKNTKYLSLGLIISFIFPIISYLLNGTLYARTKILIVLLPLVLLIIVEVLSQLKNKQLNIKLYQIPLLLMPLFFYQGKIVWMLLDVLTSVILLTLYTLKGKPQILLLMTIMPLYFLTQTNSAKQFLDISTYQQATNKEKADLIQEYSSSINGRSDDLTSPLMNANRIYSINEYKTSSYTSTSNTRYNAFFYDIIKNPISIVNRVANLNNSNIFFQGMMGVSTIYTNKKIPIGYEIVKQNEKLTIAQNNDVMPIAYATNKLLSEKDFDQLSYPYTLDTIYNNAIVAKGNTTYESKMQKEVLAYTITSQSQNLTLSKQKNSVAISAKKASKLVLELNDDLDNKILLISFNVKDIKKAASRDTSITINDIRNKLSRDNAPYPNENTHFNYIISSEEALKNLNIIFSKGEYTLDDIQIYTLDYDIISNHSNEVNPLISEATSNKEVIKGNISADEDGYFVTSLAYQKGYKAYVDGKEVTTEIVNKAFLGFPLTKGEHAITITFHAPGKQAGMYISILGIALFIINLIFEGRKRNEKPSF